MGHCGRVMCDYTICRLAGCKEPGTKVRYLGRYGGTCMQALSLHHSLESITSSLLYRLPMNWVLLAADTHSHMPLLSLDHIRPITAHSLRTRRAPPPEII